MKILIELPTWLGDTVMATSAIENLIKITNAQSVTIVGSYVSTEALKNHPKITQVFLDNTKSQKNRLLAAYRLAKQIGKHNLAVSFRSHFFSKLLTFLTGTKKRFIYKNTFKGHQVEKYNEFINSIFKTDLTPDRLKLYYKPKRFEKITIGINPGATYGSAKRWYPEYFAETANKLGQYGDIVIFGGPKETDIADDIEKMLTIKNYKNLAGKTDIPSLIKNIAGLSLFITNDSGPMHIATAYQIPTISIFGPTNPKETNQWQNPNGIVVKKDLQCAPCMKRVCPIKTHGCMKLIKPDEIIELSKKLLKNQ